VFRHSDGSAPAQVALIAGPLLLSFTAALAVPLLGFQKSQLTTAAAVIAERVARADVTENEVESIAAVVLNKLGLPGASASIAEASSLKIVRVSMISVAGIELEATGYAVEEL
jgi:hypothetical protein